MDNFDLIWALITGEYPPLRGGVSDYTRLLANGLAATGDEVHVWTPDGEGPAPEENNVQVHRLPGRFDRRSIAMLGSALRGLPASCRLFVQYVPHAYGWKAMNIPFCLWLTCWRRQPVWVLYHEVAYPLSWSQPIRLNILGAVTRGMASLVARAAERVFISIPAWEPLLPKGRPPAWLPIPSTIPTTADRALRERIRAGLVGDSGSLLIGHFGTFGPHLTPLLREILPPVLARDRNRVALLLGGGGKRFAEELIGTHPDLKGRLISPGHLPPDELAAHLAACDLLVQPYADGASGRRTSLMAGLGLGLPIVTTKGYLTEPMWEASGAVALAPALSADAFLEQTEALLADPTRRAGLGQTAARVYQDRFALENTIRELQS